MMLSKRFSQATLMLVCSALLAVAGTVVAGDDDEVKIRVFTPRENDLTGAEGAGYVISLRFKFPGDLASTGVELPGSEPDPEPEPEAETDEPLLVAVDASAASAEPGANPNFPGLVVLLSNNKDGAGNNLAKNFGVIGVSHRKYEEEAEEDDEADAATVGTHIWTNWLVDVKDQFGTVGEIERAKLLVTLVEGEAPAVVVDVNEDGKLTRKDLKLMGHKILSKVRRIPFDVNGF